MVRTYTRLVALGFLASCLVPIANVVCSRVKIGASWSSPELLLKFAAFTAVFLAPPVAVWWVLRRLRGRIEAAGRLQVRWIERLPERWLDAAIFSAAALSLFLELVVIRWQSSVFPLFSFYKNFSLLACFGGLGLGYALSGRRGIPLVLAAPLLFAHVALMRVLRHGLGWTMESIKATPIPEQLNMGLKTAAGATDFVALYLFLAATFLFTALAFIPVGQLCGRLMERRGKLRAYGWNLLGSVVGSALLMGVSFFWAPPVVWFAIAFAGLLVFASFDRRALLATAAFSLAALAVLSWPVAFPNHRIYSPYQLIERSAGEGGLMEIRAAGLYHQRVFDLSEENANRRADPRLAHAADYYEFPYRVQDEPGRVAVVGSGTGNDVAAALRAGAERVDAIEIDPAILELGDKFHPEDPYGDDRTRTFVNDARTFLRNAEARYDMIVYGLLDSHTLLSHNSSVRLDSFVYTVEAFREARERLTDDGLISLSFCVISPELGRKIYLMLEEAFGGRAPTCVRADYDGSVIFLQGRGGGPEVPGRLLAAAGFTDVTSKYADASIRTAVSTDDWPFFYMPRRVYPASYLGMGALVIALTVVLVRSFLGGGLGFGHSVFFFMGAGFMLVETKAITEMGLTFGNTWHVIGFVISALLTMAFFANCFVAWRRPRSAAIPFALLVVSLAAGVAVARAGGFPSTLWGKVATAALLTSPMFFSGLVFSTLLQRAENISGAMAANLVGSMLGGLLEYNSMYFGFQFLYLLGIGLYVLAVLSSLRKPAPAGASAPALEGA